MPEVLVTSNIEVVLPREKVKMEFDGKSEAERVDVLRGLVIEARDEWDSKKGAEGLHQPGEWQKWVNDETSAGCLVKSLFRQESGRESVRARAAGRGDFLLNENVMREFGCLWRMFEARGRLESDDSTAVDVMAIRSAVAEVKMDDLRYFVRELVGKNGVTGADGFEFLDDVRGGKRGFFEYQSKKGEVEAEFMRNVTSRGLSEVESNTILGAAKDFYAITGRWNEMGGTGVNKMRMKVLTDILNTVDAIRQDASGFSDYVWNDKQARAFNAGIGSFVTEMVRPYWKNPKQWPGGDASRPGAAFSSEEVRKPYKADQLRMAFRKKDDGSTQAEKDAIELENAGKVPDLQTYYLDVLKNAGMVDLVKVYGQTQTQFGGLIHMIAVLNNKDHAKESLLGQLGSKVFGNMYPRWEEEEYGTPDKEAAAKRKLLTLRERTTEILKIVADYYRSYSVPGDSAIGFVPKIYEREMTQKYRGKMPERMKLYKGAKDGRGETALMFAPYFGWLKGSSTHPNPEFDSLVAKHCGSMEWMLKMYDEAIKDKQLPAAVQISLGLAGTLLQGVRATAKAGKI